MGSSSDGGYGAPPRSPAPPGGMISPQGQSTPFQPHFINFLGDTNVPSTGLTPEMLAAINATNGPPPGSMPPPQMAAGGPPQRPQGDPRRQLAQAMMQQAQSVNRERGGGSSR